jgi:hypothetical protein
VALIHQSLSLQNQQMGSSNDWQGYDWKGRIECVFVYFQRPDIQCVNGGLGCVDGFGDEGTGWDSESMSSGWVVRCRPRRPTPLPRTAHVDTRPRVDDDAAGWDI